MYEFKTGNVTLRTLEPLKNNILEARYYIPRPRYLGCDEVPIWDVDFDEYIGYFANGSLEGVSFKDFLKSIEMENSQMIVYGRAHGHKADYTSEIEIIIA